MNASSSSLKRKLKTSFRASPRSLKPVYTGGPVLLSRDGRWLTTTLNEEVLITDLSTGLELARIKGDGSAITSLTLAYHTSPPTLITSHLSHTVRYYPITSGTLSYTRQLPKASTAPILVSSTSPDDTLFATGSSDGVVTVWDLAGGYVTHSFKGHGGPVSALAWRFSEGVMELITGSSDSRVRIFDLRASKAGKAKEVLEGHVSVVRGLAVSRDGRYLVSGGRDRVVLVWDLTGKKRKGAVGVEQVQTVLVEEQVEALGLVEEGVLGLGDGLRVWTAGEKGLVKIWDVKSGEEVGSLSGLEGVDEIEAGEDEQRGITNAQYDPSSSSIVSVHADQNIIFHSLLTGTPTRQIIGFNDEIIDAAYLSSSSTSPDNHLALATNSNLIRVYSTATLDARLLSGHTDMVLCLATSLTRTILASGSKDRTARLWTPRTHDDETKWACIAICEGHAESIGAVALSRHAEPPSLVTASQDRTLKLWDLRDLDHESETPAKPRSLSTLRAHEKDINSLDISPNDRLLASGSQDKTVKIFEIHNGALRLLGTCTGHKRGVWSVRFSTVDRVVASGAADRSVRLWSLDDYSCLKMSLVPTFEGHTNSVLRVDFLSAGMQLVTTASDGLVKLWNIKDEECVKTLDNHEDKVRALDRAQKRIEEQIWALALSQDEKTIVSAGADSIATFWEDSTEAEQSEKNDAIVKAVQSEQDFTNYLALKDYRRAILLALAMSQPRRLLSLFTTILSSSDTSTGPSTSPTGSTELDAVIRDLGPLDLVRLLTHIRDWNANARTSTTAQGVLHAVLRLRRAEDIVEAFEKAGSIAAVSVPKDGEQSVGRKRKAGAPGLREVLEGLIPYSKRHFARLDRLVQESYVLDYVVGEMDGGLFGAEIMEAR